MSPYDTPEQRAADRLDGLRAGLDQSLPLAFELLESIMAVPRDADHATLCAALSRIQSLAAQIDAVIEDRRDADTYAEHWPALGQTPQRDASAAVARGEDRFCKQCHGNGFVRDEDCVCRCPSCAGSGSEAVVRPDQEDAA